MKRAVAVCAVLAVLFQSELSAQEKEGDEPLPPRRSAPVKFGAAGGFTPSWLFCDMAPINAVLAGSGAAPLSDDPLFLRGGQGYAYILVLPNVRVGGMGAGGSKKSLAISGNTRREVEFTVTMGGVTADYVIPVMPRLDVSVGALLGGGSVELRMTRDDGTPKVWDNLWGEYGSTQSAPEYTRRLEGSFFVYAPSVSAEFALLRWLGVRAGAGYVGMAGGEWKLDARYDLVNVPEGVSGKGWTINAGLFIGTFVY